MRSRRRRILVTTAAAVGSVLVIAQFVPYGRDHTNPPVVGEPTWDRAETRALAVRACFDCHSNETHWPWYSHVAPVSWLVQSHVDEGRAELNFSEWSSIGEEADEAAEAVLDREMPPASYVALHPSARLSTGERQLLAQGLAALGGDGGDRDDD